jgi:hypothetical protein
MVHPASQWVTELCKDGASSIGAGSLAPCAMSNSTAICSASKIRGPCGPCPCVARNAESPGVRPAPTGACGRATPIHKVGIGRLLRGRLAGDSGRRRGGRRDDAGTRAGLGTLMRHDFVLSALRSGRSGRGGWTSSGSCARKEAASLALPRCDLPRGPRVCETPGLTLCAVGGTDLPQVTPFSNHQPRPVEISAPSISAPSCVDQQCGVERPRAPGRRVGRRRWGRALVVSPVWR